MPFDEMVGHLDDLVDFAVFEGYTSMAVVLEYARRIFTSDREFYSTILLGERAAVRVEIEVDRSAGDRAGNDATPASSDRPADDQTRGPL